MNFKDFFNEKLKEDPEDTKRSLYHLCYILLKGSVNNAACRQVVLSIVEGKTTVEGWFVEACAYLDENQDD